MKKLLLATVASMALTVPALAQNAPGQDQSQQPSQMQQQPAQPQGMQGPSSGQQAAISPSRLNRTDVRHIQQALDTKGFTTRSTDGRWGPETEAALRKFQQQQNIDQMTAGVTDSRSERCDSEIRALIELLPAP